jgi:hypothetical protein
MNPQHWLILHKKDSGRYSFERRGRDPSSKDPLRLPGHGEGVSVRVEAAHYLEAEGHAPGAQSQGNLPEEGKYCISSKNPQKLKFNLAIFFYFYLSDGKTENVEDAGIGEIEGFN